MPVVVVKAERIEQGLPIAPVQLVPECCVRAEHDVTEGTTNQQQQPAEETLAWVWIGDGALAHVLCNPTVELADLTHIAGECG